MGEWAKDLMYKVEGRTDELPPDSDREDVGTNGPGASPGTNGVPDATTAIMAAKGKSKDIASAMAAAAAAAAAKRRGSDLREGEDSSSASESSRSKQRRKRRKREKRKLGMMGYGDYYVRGQGDLHISPEVMMMMNNPLAMMGMGTPMMTHQMPMMQPTGMKMKKEDKAKRDKPEEKVKKEVNRDIRDRDPRKEKADQPAGVGATA